MITFDNVQKQYPDGTVAVDGLSLEVPTGTLTVLVGPSGCGKTTSLRMINRMVDPTAGRVLVNGRPAHREPLAAGGNPFYSAAFAAWPPVEAWSGSTYVTELAAFCQGTGFNTR